MRIIGTTFVFALLLLGLCVYVARVVPVNIESSISTEIERKFVDNDLPQIDISVHGRDVTLAGSVDSQTQLDLAMQLASRNAGVRAVMTTMVVVADESVLDNE